MKRQLIVLVAATALVVSGCGGGDESKGSDANRTGGGPGGSGAPFQTGDAASNPACELLDVADVEAATGTTISEINGTATPGQFAKDSHNCFWIGAESTKPWEVAVNLEDGLGDAVSVATSAVQAGTELDGKEVPGLGDVAVAGFSAVRVVDGDRYLMVQVSKGDDGDEAATTQKAVELAQGILGDSGDPGSTGTGTADGAAGAALGGDETTEGGTLGAGQAAEPAMTGDAAENASCALASVDEIQEQVGTTVNGVNGLTGPGGFGKTMPACTWYLDSTEVQASIALQWEHPIGSNHDPVVEGYRQVVASRLAERVPGVGDFAIYQGTTAEAVAGDKIVRVSVIMHVPPTAADKANAIALLKLALTRAKP